MRQQIVLLLVVALCASFAACQYTHYDCARYDALTQTSGC